MQRAIVTHLILNQEQERQRDQLETQLKTIKNYDDEAKQRMKEMKEQQCLMEQKEVWNPSELSRSIMCQKMCILNRLK